MKREKAADMKINRINFVRIAAGLGVVFLTGCDRPAKEPGSAEKAGAALDRVAEKTEDTAITAAEKTRAAADKAVKATENFADKSVQKTGEALEKAGAAMEKTGAEMQE